MTESNSEDDSIILDLIGFFCPVPIHETRKVLDKMENGVTIQAGDELIKSTIKVANGRLTCAESLGHKEFVMTKLYRSA